MRDVLEMMDNCAKGYVRKKGAHNWRIFFGTGAFATLPFGRHGSRENPEIEIGHVRTMIRKLGVDKACAESRLLQLAGKLD